MRRLGFRLALCALGMALAPQASADWPTKPITIIVPFAPGGAVDFTARLLQEELSKELGVSVVVENKAGGATVPAAEALVHAKPDGHTLGLFASAFAANAVLQPKLPYDTLKDVTPISRVVKNTSLILVQPSSPDKTLADFVKSAKASPGTISYATPGVATAQHLAAELFQSTAGVELSHVPYNGAGPALNDMLGGHAPAGFLGIGPTHPHVKSGKLRALAITTDSRSPILPDVPTVAEQGYPSYNYGEWFGVLAPKGTPPAVVERLRAALEKAAKSPQYAKKLQDAGLEPEATSPEEFTKFLASEVERIRKIATQAKMLPK